MYVVTLTTAGQRPNLTHVAKHKVFTHELCHWIQNSQFPWGTCVQPQIVHPTHVHRATVCPTSPHLTPDLRSSPITASLNGMLLLSLKCGSATCSPYLPCPDTPAPLTNDFCPSIPVRSTGCIEWPERSFWNALAVIALWSWMAQCMQTDYISLLVDEYYVCGHSLIMSTENGRSLQLPRAAELGQIMQNALVFINIFYEIHSIFFDRLL